LFGADLSLSDKVLFADGLYSRNMFELASKEYESVLVSDPKIEGADAIHFRLGECYRMMGEADKSEKQYRNVMFQYPDSDLKERATYARANYYKGQGLDSSAIAIYKSVLKSANSPTEIKGACLFNLGTLYRKSGDVTNAVSSLEVLSKDYKGSEFCPFGQLELADIYTTSFAKDAAKQKKAIVLYKDIIDSKAPDKVKIEALFRLGYVYYNLKDYQNSSAVYQRLVLTYPKSERAKEAELQTIWSTFNSGLYAQTLKMIDTMSKNQDTSVDVLYLKANCERRLAKVPETIATYQELLTKYPNSKYAASATYELALFAYKYGKYDLTVQYSQRLLNDSEYRQDVYWLLAEVAEKKSDINSAIQYYKLLTEKYPDAPLAPEAFYKLAYSYQKQKNYQLAGQIYESIYAKYPSFKQVAQSLFAAGICYERADQFALAVKSWKLLIDKYPKSEHVESSHYYVAMIALRMENYSEAKFSLQTLIAKFPKSTYLSRAYYWLGVIFDTDKSYKDAVESFQQSLALNPVQDVKIDAEYGLAMVLYKMGKEDEAMTLFLSLLQTSKSDNYTEGLLRWLITLTYSKGEYADTQDECEILFAKKPANAVEQFGLLYAGKSAMKLGDTVKGKEYLEKIISDSVVTVYQADAYLELAAVELNEKQYNKAFEYYSMAAKLANGEEQRRIRAFGYAGMGEASEMLGNNDDALRYYMSVGLLFNGDELVPKCLSKASKILEDKGETEKADGLKKELKQNYPDSKEAKSL
jgi:tetratricopeptide (TPR) repeat protein